MELSENIELKNQIIISAKQVFAKFGYKKTTLDEIGKSCGKGKTGIYYYFKNKEDIFKEVIKKEAEELNNTILTNVIIKKDPIEKLKCYFITRTQALLNVSNLYDAMKNELLDHLNFINKIRVEYETNELNLLKEILKEGIKQKKIRKINIDDTSKNLLLLIRSLEIPYFLNKDAEIDKNLKNFIDIIINGLADKSYKNVK